MVRWNTEIEGRVQNNLRRTCEVFTFRFPFLLSVRFRTESDLAGRGKPTRLPNLFIASLSTVEMTQVLGTDLPLRQTGQVERRVTCQKEGRREG